VVGLQTMAAEDVSVFLSRVPGVFFFVGSADQARGLAYGHHHPRFDFNEDALVTGAALLAEAVASHVLPA
ncbi:MAG: M20/M25/M40 family metallo-hydrolase, partial [Aggregatilineales bacterium]